MKWCVSKVWVEVDVLGVEIGVEHDCDDGGKVWEGD